MSLNKLPEVLEWKYGCVAGCAWDEVTGWVITSWKHPSIPQPSLEQLALDAVDYVAAGVEENKKIRQQIAALDQKRLRPMAEGDMAYLIQLNEQIVALRAQLT